MALKIPILLWSKKSKLTKRFFFFWFGVCVCVTSSSVKRLELNAGDVFVGCLGWKNPNPYAQIISHWWYFAEFPFFPFFRVQLMTIFMIKFMVSLCHHFFVFFSCKQVVYRLLTILSLILIMLFFTDLLLHYWLGFWVRFWEHLLDFVLVDGNV